MKALLLIDLINDMVGVNGKLAGKGYRSFAEKHETAKHVGHWRDDVSVDFVVHVGLQFRESYPELPKNSILLGKVAEFGVAAENGAGAEFVEWALPQEADITIRKRRISAFHGTDLDLLLSSRGVDTVVIGGVATDLAVSSAARDAHDRDFIVQVAPEICVAATDEDHENALKHIAKFATLV